jgi:hypothetical protein
VCQEEGESQGVEVWAHLLVEHTIPLIDVRDIALICIESLPGPLGSLVQVGIELVHHFIDRVLAGLAIRIKEGVGVPIQVFCCFTGAPSRRGDDLLLCGWRRVDESPGF